MIFHPATKPGILAAKAVKKRYPSIQGFCADAGYRGAFVSDIRQQLGLYVDISGKIKPHQKPPDGAAFNINMKPSCPA